MDDGDLTDELDTEQQALEGPSGEDSDEWGYVAFSASIVDTPPTSDIDKEAVSFLDTPVEGLDDDGFLLASWAMDETRVAWKFLLHSSNGTFIV